MEDTGKHTSVYKLVVLCAKSISSRRNLSLVCKEQFNQLFQLEFPVTVLNSALSPLPINVLLELEEKFLDFRSAFHNVWFRIFRRCQLKSLSFRAKTRNILPKCKDNLDDLDTSELRRCKEIFMDLYFKEVMEDYVARCKRHRQAKMPYFGSQRMLYDALGQNQHTNSEIEMLCMALKLKQSLNIESKHIDFLTDVFGMEKCFRNITKLDLFLFHNSDKEISKWKSLLETVFSSTDVSELKVKIAIPCPKFKDLLHFCLGSGASVENVSLWDEAVLGYPSNNSACDSETMSGLYDNIVQCNASFSNKKALCSIKELTIECSFTGSGLDSFFEGVLPSCIFLEKVTAHCNRDSCITIDLVRGLKILCESGHSRLQLLTIRHGVFSVAEIITLGFSLNSANSYNKDIKFDACVCKNSEQSRGCMEESLHGLVPKVGSYTIATLSIFLPHPAPPPLLNWFLIYFNPENLFIIETMDVFDFGGTVLMHPIPFEKSKVNTRLKSIKYENSYGISSFFNFVKFILSFLGKETSVVDLVACALDQNIKNHVPNLVRNFKTVTFKIKEPHDQTSYSLEDYVSQM